MSCGWDLREGIQLRIRVSSKLHTPGNWNCRLPYSRRSFHHEWRARVVVQRGLLKQMHAITRRAIPCLSADNSTYYICLPRHSDHCHLERTARGQLTQKVPLRASLVRLDVGSMAARFRHKKLNKPGGCHEVSARESCIHGRPGLLEP